MKKFLGTLKGKLAVAATAATVAATQASAAIDTTDVTFATDDAVTVAGLVLLGVGVMWGIKKAIAIGNRG